jgi:mRNA-decapping enzyme subunit 2
MPETRMQLEDCEYCRWRQETSISMARSTCACACELRLQTTSETRSLVLKLTRPSLGLDDLCVRFIINLPEEDLSSVARICFQVEEAQWFYEDFVRPLDPSLPSMSLRSFCLRIFQHCPLLSAFSADNHMRAFEEFLLYKTRVPVRGAIMLNKAMDSVVLVKGWKKGANWSFPRGKINKDEDDLDCAVREVYEETGYDIREAGLVPADEDVKYIEITMREQHMRLYVFRDVPMETHFEPRTRKEISKIQWYRLSELPAFRKKGQSQTQDGVEAAVNANKFYMVAPFLVPLKKWVVEQKKKDAQRALSSQHLAPSVVDDLMTEEESGVERKSPQMAFQIHEPRIQSTPGLDTMEGATAALHRLLKIQPPTQGLQPEAASAVQSPASRSSGEALLALLQGKSTGTPQSSPQPQPQTSLDLTYTDAPISKTPPHHHFRPPLPANMPPPPSFPLQSHLNLYPHMHSQPRTMQQSERHIFGPNQMSSQYYPPQHQEPSRQVYQPQQLQHPQPLPPQIQRAVFTGDQAHGPVVPQLSMLQPLLQHTESISLTVQQPQFPNIHGPVISPTLSQNHPKLTSHSLALLNAFKGPRDQATSASDRESNIPLTRFTEAIPGPLAQMQELSADESQHDRPTPPDLSKLNTGTYSLPAGSVVPTRAAPVDDHRKSLLSIFKNTNNKSVTVDPAATITTPADIQQASEASSSRQPSVDPALSILSRPAKRAQQQSHLSGPSSSFRPVSILARPSQDPAQSPTIYKPAKTRQDDVLKSYLNNTGRPITEDRKFQADVELSGDSVKSFQPQILKRPQPTQPFMPVELAASPTFPPSFYTQPSLDRRVNQPPEQKQALLSLFRNIPAAAPPAPLDQNKASQIPERAFDMAPDVIPRSRVDSLASAGGEMLSENSSRRGSHAPISAADKGFLLGYLDAIARGGEK